MTTDDEVELAIRRAYARAVNPGVRAALDEALAALDADVPELRECSRCGRIGLPEQGAAYEY